MGNKIPISFVIAGLEHLMNIIKDEWRILGLVLSLKTLTYPETRFSEPQIKTVNVMWIARLSRNWKVEFITEGSI